MLIQEHVDHHICAEYGEAEIVEGVELPQFDLLVLVDKRGKVGVDEWRGEAKNDQSHLPCLVDTWSLGDRELASACF